MILNIRIYLLLFICLSFITDIQAQQLQFSKQKIEQGYHFSYQWLDNTKTQQSLDFSLTETALFDRFRKFKTYQPTLVKKVIYQAIQKHLQQTPIAGVQVIFPKNSHNQNIEIKGRNQAQVNQAYQKVSQLEQKFSQQYLTDNYYHQFTTYDQITGVKPHHTAIANASIGDLKTIKPLILDKVSIQNIRLVTNYVLGFVQNIPYSTLESRISSSGAGFNPPLKVLWENQGDCDSKMTLTAAILRALMPRISMVFVYSEQHAFIGIAIPPEAGDMTVTENDMTYVLAEPTGPALLNLGKLSPASEQAIYRGHYGLEVY